MTRSRAVERAVTVLDGRSVHPTWMLPVLMYHHVDVERPDSNFDPVLLSATPEGFEEQVRLLARDYTPLSIETLIDVRHGRATLPERAVFVTFDDAYVDFAEHAWPVLRRHGVPVTLFVPTGYPDTADADFWWDRLYRAFTRTDRTHELPTPVGLLSLATVADRRDACHALAERVKGYSHDEAMSIVDGVIAELGPVSPAAAVLGWSDLRRLADEGVTIAPHSRTHAMLDQLPIEQLETEILGSKRDIEEEIGHCPPVFSYPAGQHSPLVERMVEIASFEIAFSTERGINDVRSARWLALRRIPVDGRVTPTVLRALLNRSGARLLRIIT